MSRESSGFNEVKNKYPIVSKVFVFLRHTCPEELIQTNGYVKFEVVVQTIYPDSTLIEENSKELMDAIRQYNATIVNHKHRQIEIMTENRIIYARIRTCHSIKKVDIANILKEYTAKPSQKGYIFLHFNDTYQRGDDVKPKNGRNDIIIQFKGSRRKPKSCYAILIIDLVGLNKEKKLYSQDSIGAFIRGNIPAKFVQYYPY